VRRIHGLFPEYFDDDELLPDFILPSGPVPVPYFMKDVSRLGAVWQSHFPASHCSKGKSEMADATIRCPRSVWRVGSVGRCSRLDARKRANVDPVCCCRFHPPVWVPPSHFRRTVSVRFSPSSTGTSFAWVADSAPIRSAWCIGSRTPDEGLRSIAMAGRIEWGRLSVFHLLSARPGHRDGLPFAAAREIRAGQ